MGSNWNMLVVPDALESTHIPIGIIATLMDGHHDDECCYAIFQDILLLIAIVSDPLPSSI